MGFGNGIKTDFVGCDGDDGDILDSLQSTVMLYLIKSNLPDFQGMRRVEARGELSAVHKFLVSRGGVSVVHIFLAFRGRPHCL